MNELEYRRKQEDLAALARFAVTKAWRLNTEWQRLPLVPKELIPVDFLRQVSGIFAIASYLWEEYGDKAPELFTDDERRQAKAHLN